MSNTGKWLKAKRSKYKHFYINNAAVCGSEVEASLILSKQARCNYQYCPRCKTKKVQIEKDVLRNMHDLATRLTVALVASHYDMTCQEDKLESVLYDLFDEAQVKLGFDNLIPDTQLYKKYLGI